MMIDLFLLSFVVSGFAQIRKLVMFLLYNVILFRAVVGLAIAGSNPRFCGRFFVCCCSFVNRFTRFSGPLQIKLKYNDFYVTFFAFVCRFII
jgi:hypothetical protein